MSDNDADPWAEYGGVFNPAHYPGAEAQLVGTEARLQRITSTFGPNAVDESGSPLQIPLKFIEQSDCNAFATIIDGQYAIGINVGLPLRLHAIFGLMLTAGGAFPDIGNLFERFPLGPQPIDIYLYGDIRGRGVPFERGTAEYQLGTQLLNLALDFVTFHEVTHIKNGHLAWLNRTVGLTRIDELYMAGTSGLSGIDLQTLEFDADAGGVQAIVEGIFGAQRNVDGNGPLLRFPATNFFGTIYEAARKLGFALYTMCKIFETDADAADLEQLLKQSHPPAFLRMRGVSTQIVNVLHIRGGLPVHDISMAVASGAVDAEVAWARAFGVPPVHPQAHEALIWELMGSYTDNWTKLHPILDELKWFGELAPAVNNTPWSIPGI